MKSGILAVVAACVIWGLSSIYYKQLSHVPSDEVLAHRTIWSLVFFAVVLAVQGRIGTVRAAFLPDNRWKVVIAALMISINWFLFIWSISVGRATEASLGYYIFPLVAVVLGVIVFKERMARMQIAAVMIATLAVLILSSQLGHLPWISLTLALTFGLYGVTKKRLELGPVVSVTAEVVMLVPFAIVWLLYLVSTGSSHFTQSAGTTILLVLSGPLTATPLILFSYASKRVALGTMGIIQYLNPTLQFLVATLLFREPFGSGQFMAFVLIWIALAVFTLSGLRQENARRKASPAASAPSQI
ncbi:MAG: EamA family transporter RarD [Pseudomonadota bacterium]|nr:EamA family transporter RarD [Pseudomonadota bacterium]